MKRYLHFFAFLSLLLLFACGGGKISLQRGDLSFLKGLKDFNIAFNYDGMIVGKLTEEEYVNKKVSELNEKEKGKGDTWLDNWKRDRTLKYQPIFEEAMNKRIKGKVTIKDNAQYTMIVKTVLTEPGFYAFVAAKPAYINVAIIFVETANPKNVLASFEVLENNGGGFSEGERIKNAYEVCGKTVGKFLEGVL